MTRPPPIARSLHIALCTHMASRVAPTGAERSLVLLARGLAERGHRVTVIAPGPWVLGAELAAAGIPLRVVPFAAAWLAWFEPKGPGYTLAQWARYTLRASGSRRRLAAAFDALAPDVVHVNCLPAVAAAQAAASRGLPVAWHIREILPAGGRARWHARRLRAAAARVVAVSEATAAWLRDEGLGDRVEVVHNGVDVPGVLPSPAERAAQRIAARAALGLPHEGVVVGLFGQLVPHKGALDFVDAARRAAAEEPALRFVLAGPGPDAFRARLERTAAESGGRITVLAPQAGGERLIAATDLVTLTTRTPDPFPRAVLEAMAAARPVVAYDSGGTREMVEDGVTGCLCPVGDVGALAAGFVALARDPRRIEAMGEAGARRAREQFSVALHVDRMEGLLAGLAGVAARTGGTPDPSGARRTT